MNVQDEPLVSVVTPFFNTEEYLAECIESVLAQTYQNWEYILVNNCSTDRSAEIAHHYAAKDERVVFVNNDQFLTQVQNYNHALHQINPESKYCKMVQADDMILPECISRMVAVAEENPSVGIVSAYRIWGNKVRNVGLRYPDTIYEGKDVCRNQIIYGGHYIGTPTSILIRSEIVRSKENFYREDIYFEDTMVCYEILKSWNLGFVHQVETMSRKDNDSISSKLFNYDPDWLLSIFLTIDEFGKHYLEKEEFNKKYKQIEEKYLKYLARNLLNRRDKEFWNYHETGTAMVGYELKKLKLFKYLVMELTKTMLNPVKDIKKIAFGKF